MKRFFYWVAIGFVSYEVWVLEQRMSGNFGLFYVFSKEGTRHHIRQNIYVFLWILFGLVTVLGIPLSILVISNESAFSLGYVVFMILAASWLGLSLFFQFRLALIWMAPRWKDANGIRPIEELHDRRTEQLTELELKFDRLSDRT